MKNFNFFERLWTDSHEKQRVSGMRRYAAMIAILLTFSCAQAWGASTTIFTFEVNQTGDDLTVARSGGSLSLTTSNAFTTLTGGTITAVNANASSGGPDKMVGKDSKERHVRFTATSQYLTLVLSSSTLAQGDTIVFTGNGSAEAYFTLNTTRATTIETSSYKYVIPANSTLIGESTIYIWPATTSTKMLTLSIKRPAGASTKRIYMKAGDWNGSTPDFWVHSWGASDSDVQLTAVGGCEASDLFKADIPSGNTSLLFTRQNSTTSSIQWDYADDKLWNKSQDISISTNNLFTFTGWGSGGDHPLSTFSSGTFAATTYTISFQGNGNTGGSTASHTGISCNGSQTLRANGFTRTGWTFTGWNTSAYGDGDAYDAGATITDITSDITLYAQWEKVMYMKSSQSWWYNASAWFAVWVANADETKQAWVKMTKAENCSSPAVYTATVPGNGYTKVVFVRKNPADMTLATWTNKWNQTSKESMPTSNNQFTITGGSDDNCTGSWGTYSEPKYTITFASNGADGGTAMTNVTNIACEGDVDLVANTWTKLGNTFANWKTNVAITADGSAVAANGAVADEASITDITSNITLTAQWTPNNYDVAAHTLSNVTLSSGGSTGTGVATWGTNYTATFAAADGYTLPSDVTVSIGGSTKTKGTEYTWNSSTGALTITGSYIVGNIAITVSGVSKKTVTYKMNGGAEGADGSVSGSTTDGSSPYAHGSTVTTKANGFTNTGYKFKWWNTAYDGSGEDFYVGEKFDITANTLLFAQWEEVATGQAFWVGDVAISSASTKYDVAGNGVTMQIERETNADWNSDISKDWNQVSKYSSTEKKAKVLAVDENDSYIEVNFKDGSAINALELGVCNKDGNDNEMVVIYSTTADFSSGVGEKVALNTKKYDQSTKAVYDVSPSTPDLYKYARIYRKVSTAVYGLTGGSEHIIRIYSIKAEKGAACESLDAPIGLTCSAQTKNSLTFGWSPVTNASSYDVYLYSDEDCTAEVTPTEGKPFNVTGTSATLTGLDGGTTYYCKVRTKGNGSTYCTNGGITTTAANGKTKYVVTYNGNSATSGSVPTDGNGYASGDEVTVLGKNTLAKTDYTFRGWTSGDYFYKEGDKFTMPAANVTLTAVWDIKSAGSGSTYRIPVKSAYDDQGSGTSPRYLWVTDGIGWLTWDAGTVTINSDAESYSDFSYRTKSGKNTILIYSEIASVKKIRIYCYGSNAFSCNGISTGTTYGSYSALTVSTDYTFNGNSISSSANGVIEIIFSTALAANTYVQFTFSANGKFYGVELETTGAGSGSWTNKYVAFDNNAGVVGTPSLPDTIKGVPSGKKIVQPEDPTATGYIFDNWYPTVACNTAAFDWSGTITKDTTIYAKFNAPTTLIQQPAKVAGKRVPMDTLDAKKHPEIDSVIVHQFIDPTPYGTCNISYKLCYSNHVQLDVQPTIHYGTGAGVGYDTVWMPMAEIQKYELVAYLRTDATRGEGDLVTTDTAIVSVEKTWPIKVRYVMDGIDLREPTEWSAYPSLKTTEAIRIPKERNGYILDSLEYGVGITVDSAKYIVYSGIEMYQVYLRSENAATIIAHYRVPANKVYFFDTFKDPWYTPYIFDYGTTGYWGTGSDAGKGAGAEGHLGTHATRIDFMDRMYKMPIGASTTKLAIGSDEQKNADGTGFKYFYSRIYTPEGWDHSITVKPEIFYRTDFNQALPMFVPVVKSSSDYYVENTEARYFRGFWVKYSPDRDSTGYYLKVYDRVAVDGAQLIQSIPMTLAPTGEDGTWELTATMDLEGGKTYGFKYTKATGASTVDWYGYAGTMTSANHTDWLFTTGTNNCGLTTTSAGDYTFHLHCVNYGTKAANTATDSEVQGKMVMTVDYATNEGDYRVVYVDDEQTNLTVGKSNVEPIASQTIRARENGQDTVTFYIRKDATNRSMKFQKFNAGAWSDVAGGTIDLTNTTGQTFTVSTDTTYQIYIQQNEGGTSVEATGMDYYSGLYYIRTDCVDEHKWDYKQSMEAHSMVESDYASHLTTDPFTHYFVHWVDKNKNVKFVVATQYSPTLTDTLITDDYANVSGGNLPNAGASVRFMYNKKTNWIKRAYLAGAQGGSLDPNFLKLTESNSPADHMKDMSEAVISSITFADLGNFTYQASIKAKPGLIGKLTAEYNSQTQYFKGSADASETILGGDGESWQNIVMTYDFKTNRLICAWTPGDTIDESMSINADIMIIRRGQRDAEQIVFKTNESKLTDVKYIYGVIQLDYNDLVGMMYSWDYWAYEHCMYYISFPFDVAVNDITGVGSIGKEWRIQRYNGAKRAEKGWFAGDGVTTFWEDVNAGDTLHAYEGYSLLLNRVRFNDSRNAIWENKSYGSSVYLFFPSLNATTGVVADGEVTVKVPSHLCTIDRNFTNQNGVEVNHKNTDSHWNMMGTPLFENKTAFSIQDGPTIEGETLQYLYAWNSAGNTLGIQTTLNNTWQFKTMYSYMVQYAGDVVFKGSTINKSVAARRTSDSKNYHVNLELTKDELFVGRTYVELRENAVDSFLLNEDVYMVKNGVNADLYTYAGGYELGANVLTMDNHIVPVGIDVQKAGTYTFSMPSNFSGTVTLIDNFTQTRTNLAVDDYEIALPKGTINDRFELEININKMPTAIDGVDANQGALKDGKAHKFIENDQMYILKDGVLYDARGNRVK